MPNQFVVTSFEGGVATLVLNRPPMKMMNIEKIEQIRASLLEFREYSLEGRGPEWRDA